MISMRRPIHPPLAFLIPACLRDAGPALWAALAAAVSLAAPAVACAQDVQGNNPGVIKRGGNANDDSGDQNGQDDQTQDQASNAPQSSGNQTAQNADKPDEPGGQVITPENANPNEKYNLPPNFDPDYRPKRTPRNTKVTVDFRQAQLEEVVKFFAAAMNKNFIISDSLQANKTITIISSQDVSLAQSYRAFVAALEMNGLTIVPFGHFSKIVQAKQAISEPTTTYDGNDRLPSTPRMVTAILPVKNTPPDEMKKLLGEFTSQYATIIPYGNSLIVTENAANLQRLRNLMDKLDRDEAAQKVYVYEVQYAEATEIKEKLTELFEAQQNGSGGSSHRGRRRRSNKSDQSKQEARGDLNLQISQILADERTNKLIIVSNPRDFDRLREMIEILDVPTAVGGQVHVKFLEYADAEEIASTLSNLTSGQSDQSNAARRRARARRQQQQDGRGGAGKVAALLQGEVQITAYKPNNALVVTASPKDYVSLKTVINELDRPRKQVYVEAVILEIDVDTDSQYGLGVSAVTGQDYDGIVPDSAVENGLIDDTKGGIIGQSNFGGVGDLVGQGVAGSIGLLGPFATIPGTEISLPAFALTLQATQTESSVNLLSAPAVMTMDNEEAELVVADRVPIVSGLGAGGAASGLGGLGALGAGLAGNQSGQNGGALGALGGLGGALGGLGVSPIEYEDVGITLRILPQINESNFVRLEIDQEVTDLAGASTLGKEIPARTKRTTKTVVLVEDQSTIVIGGLMKDQKNETVTKIPFLGDIPVIGALFRSTGTRKTKQNLVLMLTPYIIESKSDVRKIYERKMKERKELAKLFKMEQKEYVKNVNFHKKSGLIERMRNQLNNAERSAKARQEAREAFKHNGPRYQILGQDQDGQPAGQSPPEDQAGQPDTDEQPTKPNRDQSNQSPKKSAPNPPPARQPDRPDEPNEPVDSQ